MQKRRDFVFNELHRLVGDFDEAVSASGAETNFDLDHEIGVMLIRLNGETRRVRKLQSTVKPEVVCNGT